MPDPDLTGINDGAPVFPSDRRIVNDTYVLTEIKRLLYWDNHFQIKTRDEEAFAAHTKNDVSSGGSINLHLKNPADSGVSVDVRNLHISTQFEGDYEVFDEFSSAPSGGNGSGIDNLLMDTNGGAADTGEATVSAGVSFTQSGTHFAGVIPGGGTGAAQTGGAGEATHPIIEPGREIVIRLNNGSSSAGKGSIGVVWIEEPYVYSTQ